MIVDAMPAFWEFWEAAQRAEPTERLGLFRRLLMTKHPEIYTSDVLLKQDQPLEPVLAQRLEHLFTQQAAFVPVMRDLHGRFAEAIVLHLAKFRRTFPDLQDVPIYLMASLWSFDGAIRTVHGRKALLFGIDEIARARWEVSTLGILFDHELFHVYHHAVSPEAIPEPAPLWRHLWAEGLATHVSEILNPEADPKIVLGHPRDLAERARPLLPRLVEELRANLDSTDFDTYAKYFLGGLGGDRDGLPARNGYYVGLLIARRLCADASLRHAARWSGQKLRALLERGLVQVRRESVLPTA